MKYYLKIQKENRKITNTVQKLKNDIFFVSQSKNRL